MNTQHTNATNATSLLVNAMLLTDGYKLGHITMYPKGITKLYSNFTPRSNKHFQQADKGAVVFGVQYFIKKYLVDEFNATFFNRPKNEVVEEYAALLKNFLGDAVANQIGTKLIEQLHDLGYLPITIKSLPEGEYCPLNVPMLTITNTHKDFAWLTNYLETLLSNALWKPINSATVADVFKRELIRHAITTGFYNENDTSNIDFLCHDFSMRGMSGVEDTIVSGMGHLTSFAGSESVPAIIGANYYYKSRLNCAGTIPATEHSIECANAVGLDGQPDDEVYFKEMLERFPNGFISIVSDGFDYWKMIEEIVPKYKEQILNRDGRVVIRPDSGDPVDIICGLNSRDDLEFTKGVNCMYYHQKGSKDTNFSTCSMGEYYGTYEYLYNIFGGTINPHGFKILDSHIGLIYGDAINMKRQKEIYARLEKKDFAATNLVLGIGSFTYQCVTRDNLGLAMKATYCELEQVDEQGNTTTVKKNIYKDPKTVVGMPKKSLKGLLYVDATNDSGAVTYCVRDEVTEQDEQGGALEVVFTNGKITKETTLDEIRKIRFNRAVNTVISNM